MSLETIRDGIPYLSVAWKRDFLLVFLKIKRTHNCGQGICQPPGGLRIG